MGKRTSRFLVGSVAQLLRRGRVSRATIFTPLLESTHGMWSSAE
jgi:hypothetical protein